MKPIIKKAQTIESILGYDIEMIDFDMTKLNREEMLNKYCKDGKNYIIKCIIMKAYSSVEQLDDLPNWMPASERLRPRKVKL